MKAAKAFLASWFRLKPKPATIELISKGRRVGVLGR